MVTAIDAETWLSGTNKKNREDKTDDTNTSGQSAGESTGISGPAGAAQDVVNDGTNAIENATSGAGGALGSVWDRFGPSKNTQKKQDAGAQTTGDTSDTNGPSSGGNNFSGTNNRDGNEIRVTDDGNLNIDDYLREVEDKRVNTEGGAGADEGIGVGGRQKHHGGRLQPLYEGFTSAGLDPYADSNRGFLDVDNDGIDDRIEYAKDKYESPRIGVIEQGMELMGLETPDKFKGPLKDPVKRGTEAEDESRSTAGTGGPNDKPGGNTKSGSDPNRPTDDRGRGTTFTTTSRGGAGSRSAMSMGARFGGVGAGQPGGKTPAEPDKQMSGGVIGTAVANPVMTAAGTVAVGGLAYLLLSVVGVL
jgi:hypothetical protein